jgi:putative glutamine amidotransferase
MRIGITVRSENEYYFVKKRYLEYFKDFEIVLLYPYNITYMCAQCDGFVVIGGSDANPILYGEENYASVNIDDEIDGLDMKIIDYAVKNNKPIYGICRGLQMLNIYFEGTLKQHVISHKNEPHNIILVERFLDFPHLEKVNSYHHQSVKKNGKDIQVLYYSIDGEVECFIHKKFPIIAVQFHPEMEINSEFSRLLLLYFSNLINIYKS